MTSIPALRSTAWPTPPPHRVAARAPVPGTAAPRPPAPEAPEPAAGSLEELLHELGSFRARLEQRMALTGIGRPHPPEGYRADAGLRLVVAAAPELPAGFLLQVDA